MKKEDNEEHMDIEKNPLAIKPQEYEEIKIIKLL